MIENEKMVVNAKDVAAMMGVGLTQAYGLIRKLNIELAAKGYLVVRGKVPRKYFIERTGIGAV